MNKNFEIKEIAAALTYPVRHPVLRPGKPLQECIFPGDTASSTFHLGIYKKDKLIGVASFMQVANSRFQAKSQYQLRGMAVLPEHMGEGYGAALLKAGENKILELSTASPVLWFNARDYATGFYKKYGYRCVGEKFDVPGVCPHIVMYRELKN